MELPGFILYLVPFITMASIYAIMSLGLNLQYGFTGQINIGIAGFFAVGAYSTAIFTTNPSVHHLGGFQMPFLVGLVAACVATGLIAALIGWITARLRTDYLAIATIGIAEILRLTLRNEDWLTNGVRGIPAIPRPFVEIVGVSPLATMIVVVVFLVLVYLLMERARISPWGRVLRAIRENEPAVSASGKNIARFRLESFVVGSMVMGLAGGLYAHYVGFISPEAFEPLFGTFLVWVMLIAGGAGNNKGAVLGAFVVWALWSASEIFTSSLPPQYVTQMGALRIMLIGLLLQVILIWRPQGLLPEIDRKDSKVK